MKPHILQIPLIGVVLAAGLSSTEALALPQFAVMSSRACDNCHVDPQGWDNPDVSERRCSLNCNTCHVNPTGGGLRKASGRFYGMETLSTWGVRPSEYGKKSAMDQDPEARPSSRPASQPADGDSSASEGPPGPNSKGRYGLWDPRGLFLLGPVGFNAGLDFRAMAYFLEGQDVAVFPMQTDLYLAITPYNPKGFNKGRLTLLVNGGSLGSRAEEFSGFQDRFFLREYFALFDDLPYQLYAKVGQFLPAFGWRLDDHSTFIRQGQSFNNERQVNGVEVGINPNYLYANLSVFVPGADDNRGLGGGRNRASVLDFDNGVGTAINVGYRELLWQAGASFMFENRPDRTDVWAGLTWSLNIHNARHPWKPLNWVPITYMGEFDVRSTHDKGGRTANGLAVLHEIDVLLYQGLFLQVRHEWQDPDVEIQDDHKNRYTFGAVWHPYSFVELIAQYRINQEAGDIPVRNNEGLIQLHLWF